MEWKDPYNSFNSYKGLLYRANFDGMIKGEFLPPVEVNIDPCNNCNLDCIWCNSRAVIDRKGKSVMTREHLLDLVKMCGGWGVKAICFAGGGEPTMCPDLAEAMVLTRELGMEASLITNGLFRNKEQIIAIAKSARWVGVSVDAASMTTYEKVKGANRMDEVTAGIASLVHNGAREVTWKYLIHPLNQREIYASCMAAKACGCHGFHARFMSERYLTEGKYDYDIINGQIDACYEYLDCERFRVYAIRHKQEGPGNRRINFTECKASPLLCMLEANGDVNLCIDRKGDARLKLGSHTNPQDVPKMWGSGYHKKLLSKVCPETDCPKCTMTIYQELLEAYKNDKFCVNFP